MEKLDYMKLAYEEALKAFKEDEVPIGCVIVKDDTFLSSAHNQKEKYKDATKHAEIIAIQEAVKKLNHYPDYEQGLLREECSKLLKDFFKNKR